jgi:hypothetical protein
MENWLVRLGRVAAGVRSPLSLAGLVLFLAFVLVRTVLALNVFSNIGGDNTYRLLDMLFRGLFVLAILSLVLAGLGYLADRLIKRKDNRRSKLHLVDAVVAGHAGAPKRSRPKAERFVEDGE